MHDNRITSFYGVVLASPALRARVREAIEEVETMVARLFAEAGEERPEMTAALVVASARVCYVAAAIRIMGSEQVESFRAAEQRASIAAAWDAAVAAARG